MASNAGKGSGLRPCQISSDEFNDNWNRIFKNKGTNMTHAIEVDNETKDLVNAAAIALGISEKEYIKHCVARYSEFHLPHVLEILKEVKAKINPSK